MPGGAQLVSCAVRKIDSQRYLTWINATEQIGHLSNVVSSFVSKAAHSQQELFAQKLAKACWLQKLACEQVEPVQSAHLCFLPNHLHRLPEQSALPHKKNPSNWPTPCPLTLTETLTVALRWREVLGGPDIQQAAPELFNSKL